MSDRSISCSAAAELGIWAAKRERIRAVRNKSEVERRREGGGIGRVLVVGGIMKGEGSVVMRKGNGDSTLKGGQRGVVPAATK